MSVYIPENLKEGFLEEIAQQLHFIKKLTKRHQPIIFFEPLIKITLHSEIDKDILYNYI